MVNKDPQVVLYGVLKANSNEDILAAIRSQNGHLIQPLLGGMEDRMNVKYRKKGKDDETEHVVLTVSPGLWQCLTKAGHVYIDMQRIRVADQSPLIQCSRCLGYGHGRRHCNSNEGERCSHCTGEHHQSQCEDLELTAWCINCRKEGLEMGKQGHNAFSAECPIRRRWDAIARAAVAYASDDPHT